MRSRSPAFVTMMQTADVCRLDNFTFGERLYSSLFRGVFVQQQVSSPMIVIGTIS